MPTQIFFLQSPYQER